MPYSDFDLKTVKDELIDRRLELDGFLDCCYDLTIMPDVLDRATSPIFQPLIANLISTDPILPNLLLDAFKILFLVDVDSLFLFVVFTFFDFTVAFAVKFCHRRIELRRS